MFFYISIKYAFLMVFLFFQHFIFLKMSNCQCFHKNAVFNIFLNFSPNIYDIYAIQNYQFNLAATTEWLYKKIP